MAKVDICDRCLPKEVRKSVASYFSSTCWESDPAGGSKQLGGRYVSLCGPCAEVALVAYSQIFTDECSMSRNKKVLKALGLNEMYD